MYKALKGRPTQRYEPPSPSYCSEDDQEREEYFVNNPDFEFDELPQPFRFIDKVLNSLLDRLSDEIDRLEDLKKLENNVRQLPVFKNPSLIDLSSIQDKISFEMKLVSDNAPLEGCVHPTFKASTTKSKIYVASGKQLMAIDCFTKSCLAQIAITSQDSISMLEAIPLGISDSGCVLDMIAAFDDLGNCFSFLFDGQEFFPLKLFEAVKSETASKVLKWETCNDFCFVAVTKQHPEIGNSLEIYRIPKQEWMSEYESAMKKLKANEEKFGDEDNLVTDELHETKSKSANSIDDIDELAEEGESCSHQRPSHVASYLQLRSMIPIVTLKPTRETSNAVYNSPKLYEGGRIGSGNRTILNASFYRTLRSQLKSDLSELSAIDESADLVASDSIPTVHFLKGVSTKSALESKADQRLCFHDSVGIWWSVKNQFLVYKLPKSSRDGELHCECAYANADLIAKSCVNEDTSLIAIALQNGNIIIWNRLTNEPSSVLLLKEPDLISMKFAKLYGNSERLIFGMRSGNMLQLDYGTKDLSFVPLTDQSSANQGGLLSFEVVPNHPSLLFVAREPDMITVFDLHQQLPVFHFQLPAGFCLDQSITECFILNGSLSLLLVFASMPLYHDQELHALYAYSMCIGDIWHEILSSRVDDIDLKNTEDMGPRSLESIAVELMKSIYGQKESREERRQKRWKEYEKELKN